MPKIEKVKRSRHWMITWNNPPEEHPDWTKFTGFVGVTYQKEVGKEERTPHWQIYMRLKDASTFGNMKKRIDEMGWPALHVEACKSAAAVEYYSQKEDTRVGGPWFVGECKPKQGKRNDLIRIRDMIKEGKSDSEVMDEVPSSIHMIRNLPLVRQAYAQSYEGPREVHWYYGPPGTGKTRTAMEDGAHPVDFQGQFLIGYTGQETVLFDDFRPKDIRFKDLLRLMDRYKVTFPIKGGEISWNAKKIYITSPHHPSEYCGTENPDQVLRRITYLKEFKTVEEP